MRRILAAIGHGIRGLFRSPIELALENVALRQQLAVFKHKQPRPRIRNADRVFWVVMRRLWSGWANALILVKPDTVVRWHRQGFRRYWARKSRRSGRPRTDAQIRELIRQMATETGWRAPRIHSELLKLGICVCERTVSRYLPKKPVDPDAIERWKTFLRNHRDVLAAMDFFTVPTASFRVLYVLFIIHHDRRRILHFNVTAHPTADWIIQQLREAFPFESRPRYFIYDRDDKFRGRVTAAIKNMDIEPVITGRRAPWQNGVAERWIGSARRELLDHVVVANENHLRRLLRNYVDYYHDDRCHLSLDKDAPHPRPVEHRPSSNAEVMSLPRVGGIHRRYRWRDDHRAAA